MMVVGCLYFLSRLLLHMGLGPAPTLAAAKLVPQSRPFYGYTNTLEYLCFMSASSQRYFLSPALRVFSTQMRLKIVSAIFHEG